jgi:lipopolysaccharide/colanic/teichoic acid biosynthesis glycosyltransferase
MIRTSFLPATLAVGDLIALLAAVPLALYLRWFEAPSWYLMSLHVVPFSLLALLSIVVFFSAGLYDAPTALIRREFPSTIFAVQVFIIIVAALLFFFVPEFKITPKATLLLYLVSSVILVTAWRFAALTLSRAKEEYAVLIADGADADELANEFSEKGLLPFKLVRLSAGSASLKADLETALSKNPVFVVADSDDPRLARTESLLDRYESEGGRRVDFSDFYERIFKRLSLLSLSYRSVRHREGVSSAAYGVVKRVADFVFSIPLFLLLVFLTPFVYLALRLEGEGPLFIHQERIGRHWHKIRVTKFRTMTRNKAASSEWTVEEKNDNRVTKVGAFLRKTSIDELPQVLSVLSGELSLIGPRSDIAGLGERLAEELPSYRARYQATPGISGWAQVNQRYAPGRISPQSVEESRVRLTYDLYYVKHRSLLLDISITLRTIKTLIARLIS